MGIELIITTNLIPFLGLIFLIFFVCLNPLYNKHQRKYFLTAVIVTLLMIIVISLDYYLSYDPFENDWMLRRVTSFLNFATSPLIPLFLLKIFSDKKLNRIYYIPFILNAILCFISIFVNVVFLIREDNSYARGSLFFIPITVSLMYLILLIAKPISFHQRSKKIERIFLLGVCGAILLGMSLEVIIGYRFLSWDICAISLVLYYLLVTIQCFIIDTLTGAYNRVMYHNSLSTIDGERNCIIVYADLNNFKQINDEKGHDYGDKCLILFVKVIDEYSAHNGTLYRLGGDEFVYLSKKNVDIQTVKAMIDASQKELNANGISFAYGIVEYKKGGVLQDALDTADKLMYKNKGVMKNT